MALVHTDRFEHYLRAHLGRVYNDFLETATIALGSYGPGGTPGIRFSGSGSWQDYVARGSLSTSGATTIQQFDFRISAAPPGTNALASVADSGTTHLSLGMNTSRQLQVFRGTVGGTLLGTSTYVVPLNTYIHVGWKSVINNSTGSSVVHVWEDGDTAAEVVINVTNADTQDTGSATWNYAGIGGINDGSTDFANYVMMDGSGSACNDLLGPVDLATLWSSSRTTPSLTDWALSSGSDQAALLDDATPDDDTTYCSETDQNGQITVPVDVIPYPGRTIKGNQLYACAKLTSGSPSVSPIGYQSSTAHLGTAASPTSSYNYVMQPYSAMPSGAAFTTTDAFDALQWGLKLTTASTGVRLTQVAVVVILARPQGSKRNLLTGKTHEVTGDDNLIAGRENDVTGAMSQVHGTLGTVVGNRTVLFNLTGLPYTVTGDGKFVVNADEVIFLGTVTQNGSAAAPAGNSWSVLTAGGEIVFDSNGDVVMVETPRS